MLHALERSRYEATGTYYPSDGGDEGRPLEWHGRARREGALFVMEGSYRPHLGAQEYPFYLELTAAGSAASGKLYLHCPHLNDATGFFRETETGVCMAGRAAGIGAAVSLSVMESSLGGLEGNGTLVFASGMVWLAHFHAVPTQHRATRADVVSLRRGGC